jgi:hypothetical protein
MRRALVCGLAVLAAVGCSGGGGGGTDQSEISPADLALMVLPREAFAEEYTELEVDPDSGPKDNAAAAEDTIDPEATKPTSSAPVASAAMTSPIRLRA